jgi:hypothetical protein
MRSLFLFFCLFFLTCSFAQITSVEKRIYHATRLSTTPPLIDGRLNDSLWLTGKWQGNFTQQMPREGEKPTMPTWIKMSYDNDNMYVGIFCVDDPQKINKVFSPRDEFSGDATGIAFDSYFNQQTACEFNLTAAGQKIDLMHTGNGNYDFNWNANWEGKTSVNDTGWFAEFRIPFSQIRYNKLEDHTWGMHIWRWLDRNKEESQWKLIPINAPAGVHNFGIIDSISHIRTSRQAELMPYVSFKYDYNGSNENPYISNGKFVPNGGIDAKIGISSNFTLDATINPDFGQVEADPAELNLSAYESYFEEKRPFFLEGKDIFDFSIEGNSLFYSRRIGATPTYEPETEDNDEYTPPENTTILGSGKITGRTINGFSVGILETVTANEYGKIYRPELNVAAGKDSFQVHKTLVEPLTNYFASRFKKLSPSANTMVGGSFNSVIRAINSDELNQELIRSAHSAGIDFNQYFLNKNYSIKANSMFSHLEGSKNAILLKQESHIHRFQRPDADYIEVDSNRTSLTGSGGSLEFAKQGGKYRFGSRTSYWSPELNINDIGYMAETDYIEEQGWFTIFDSKEKKHMRQYNLEVFSSNRWTFGGEHTRSSISANYQMQLTNLWNVILIGEKVFPVYDPRILRGGPALYVIGYFGGGAIVETNTSKRFFCQLEYHHYVNENKSTYDFTQLGFNYNPIDKLKFSVNFWQEIKHFAYEYFEADFNNSDPNYYMMGWLDQNTLSMTMRAEYYIRPEISFQLYGNPLFSTVDYSEFSRVNEAGATDASKRFYVYVPEEEIKLNSDNTTYTIRENNGENYSFKNPDRSFGEFRSNLVFRWEYKLGSVFYLVWTHQQSNDVTINQPEMNNTISELFTIAPHDVFLMKFSYWFNM